MYSWPISRAREAWSYLGRVRCLLFWDLDRYKQDGNLDVPPGIPCWVGAGENLNNRLLGGFVKNTSLGHPVTLRTTPHMTPMISFVACDPEQQAVGGFWRLKTYYGE